MSSTREQSLRLIIGGDGSNTFEIREGETLTLGRDPGCTIQINHDSVSPYHCRLEFNEGVLLVTDLDSQAGISYQSKKKRQLSLKNDTSFMLGEVDVTTFRSVALTSYATFKRPAKKVSLMPVLPLAVPRIPGMVTSQARIRKAARKVPFLALSLVFHFIIFLFISDLSFFTRKANTIQRILAQVISPDEKIPLEDELEPPEEIFDEPEPLEDDLLEPDENPLVFEEELEVIEPIPTELQIGILGTGGQGISRLSGEGAADLTRLPYSKGFRKHINSLRQSGMDVVFIIDTTSSMTPFLDEAKRVVGRLISKLAAVVPNQRLSMVVYRDKGDEYVTRHLDLTDDRYEILNFLEDSQASGGGDFPEAIYDALNRAIHSLMWRPQAKRTIILIGDAPFHDKDCNRIDKLLREFAKGDNPGIVNTVYIGPVTDPPTYNQKTAVESMEHIAQVSGGEFSWISENDKIVHSLISLAFGSRWDMDVNRLLETVKTGRMNRLIERKARGRQKDWLLEGLKKAPVRAGIVDALIEAAGPAELEELVKYLESPTLPEETKWASLYVLRKIIGRHFSYNPGSNPDMQLKELLVIRKAVSDYNPKANR